MDCAKLLARETILKCQPCSQLTCNPYAVRDIVQVCIRTSQSKNPTKRYSLASKRKWMSRAWPNPREKNMTSTTPRCRNWKSCRNRGGQEFRGRSGAGGAPEGGNNGKAGQTSS